MTEYLIIGLKEISKHTPWNYDNFRQHYKHKLIACNAIFKSKIARRWTYWTYKSRLERYFERAIDENGRI